MLLLIFKGHQEISVLHPEEIWGQWFHLDVCSIFLKTSKILFIYIILHIFSLLFLAV